MSQKLYDIITRPYWIIFAFMVGTAFGYAWAYQAFKRFIVGCM